VKDIRMVKDRISLKDEYRDYAFVEYFTIEDSTKALDEMKINPLFIRGFQIFGAYSKIKKDDDKSYQQVILLLFI
jgi:RNA recognition motif-containing protein